MDIDPRDVSAPVAYKLLTSLIVPRPIAWVATIGPTGGYNLAPFSFFTGVCYQPPTICVSVLRRDGTKKDTERNIDFAGEFVVNVVDDERAAAMNATAANYPPEVSEFEQAGLTPLPSDVVRPPRVAEAPASLECRLVHSLELGEDIYKARLFLGEVVRFHVRDDLYLGDGKVDMAKLQATGRLVGTLYCRTSDIFAMASAYVTPSQG